MRSTGHSSARSSRRQLYGEGGTSRAMQATVTRPHHEGRASPRRTSRGGTDYQNQSTLHGSRVDEVLGGGGDIFTD